MIDSHKKDMKIASKIIVPTGEIYTAVGERGKLLEFLSIGDYGKDANIKADFLGITRELNGVPNGKVMPLSEKWVITISTQYGCSMNCKFCDVPKVGAGLNATLNDLNNQILTAIKQHPEITHTKRLNIHFARMGEPTWNPAVLECAIGLKELIKPYLGDSIVHPVVSTMIPRENRNLIQFIEEWCMIKNKVYNGDAGLQFSINSTSTIQRISLFNGNSMGLRYISQIGKVLPYPKGRKYTLNFALADETIIDARTLLSLFDPDKFMIKITPLHRTTACMENDLRTTGGYDFFTPYKEVEEELKRVGFDVLIFVPSYDEDNSLITCGNAVLSGTEIKSEHQVINM